MRNAMKGQLDNVPGKTLTDNFYQLSCFVKPYEGNLWREGGSISSIRFYNEREWRFVPELPEGFFRYGMNKEHFLESAKRTESNNELAKVARISFEPNDIKYLIVRREDEIVPLIREVEHIKGRYSYDDVRLVSSRVISAEQITSDF